MDLVLDNDHMVLWASQDFRRIDILGEEHEHHDEGEGDEDDGDNVVGDGGHRQSRWKLPLHRQCRTCFWGQTSSELCWLFECGSKWKPLLGVGKEVTRGMASSLKIHAIPNQSDLILNIIWENYNPTTNMILFPPKMYVNKYKIKTNKY